MIVLQRALIATAVLASLAQSATRDAMASGEDGTPTAWSPLPFSAMMRALSDQPAFVDGIIDRLGRSPAASAMLGPLQEERLREILRARDWVALDSFPTLTVGELGTAARVAGAVTKRGGNEDADAAATAAEPANPPAAPVIPDDGEIELGLPTHLPPPEPAAFERSLGFGVLVGDALDPDGAPRMPDSERFAAILDRISRNPASGQQGPRLRVRLGDRVLDDPDALVSALEATGHRVLVRDVRYFANFGDLRFEGRDVLTPFWIDTGVPVPGRDETLRVPAAHAQHEIEIRGPRVNVDLAFFFGVDGRAAFRSMGTRDQAWTLGRAVWRYEGERAHAALWMMAEVVRVWAALQTAHPELPFGGYFRLGVCNDVNAILEAALQGHTTAYPLTRTLSYFTGDDAVSRLARILPVDSGRVAGDAVERILGTLPTDDLSRIALPGLREDLRAVANAHASGVDLLAGLRRRGVLRGVVLLVAIALALVGWRRLRRRGS